MPMLKQNISIAKQILDGATLSEMAAKTGLSRKRIHQITIAFCVEWMMDHEKLDDNGKLKPLKQLRAAWREWDTVWYC